jgi:uncharacterized peroxidase-related enzyme
MNAAEKHAQLTKVFRHLAYPRRYSRTANNCFIAKENPMPHITLPDGLPGITGPFAFRPETAKPMRALAEFLLRGPNTLSSADREISATYTSSENDCHFCQTSHGAAAAHHLGGPSELASNFALIAEIKRDFESAPISAKLKALLNIAGHVQQGGKRVTAEDIARARKQGATDTEIHDTVLIAAAFCMYNRYVDGLATWAPQEQEAYIPMGARLAHEGYVDAPAQNPAKHPEAVSV